MGSRMPDLQEVKTTESVASHVDAVEVTFDDDEQNAFHKSRSSLKSNIDNNHQEEPASPFSECFVHSLLSNHYKTSFIKSLPLKQQTDETTEATENNDPQQNLHHHVQSRLLSKKQLSDMAFGIRELSKRLSHIRLKVQVQNIFVLAKIYDDSVVDYTRDLVMWLLENDCNAKVYVEDTLQDNSKFNAQNILENNPSARSRLRYWTEELCREKPHIFDIVLCLGGDGTVLYASYLFQRIVPPVLAFALGSLGFLTKFDYESRQQSLQQVFSEGFNVNLRLRFEATIMRNLHKGNIKNKDLLEEIVGEDASKVTHHPSESHNILNDIVLDRGPSGTMITLEVFGDNEHFTTIQADGICVATPTGSTAYNLAAGGSLCHPDNPVVLLTAICAHTLSFRPIILPDTIVLRIGLPYDSRTDASISFDGRERVELKPGDYVVISASRFPFPSVLPLGQKHENWIDSISRTLNWNSRQRQKAWRSPS